MILENSQNKKSEPKAFKMATHIEVFDSFFN